MVSSPLNFNNKAGEDTTHPRQFSNPIKPQTMENNATKYTYKVYQDEQLKKEFNEQTDDFAPFKFILNNQGQSMNYALKYGGWKVEEINEQTKESRFWNPYA